MPRLTENYCRQELNENLADLPRYGDGPARVRFTHVLNPYRGKTEHDRALQEITFETIRMAARAAAPTVQVRCVCVTNADELDVVPADFIAAGTLTRTVLDVGDFSVRRALPLVFDILDLGIGVMEDGPETADCEDFIIFTNMDIHLQPHFYSVVSEFIKEGYDIIDVHRRTIPNYQPSLDQLPAMFAEPGVHHGGLDCIIFPRRKYPLFVKNHACVGMSLVMKGVLLNCVMQAKRFLVLSNARLTFHLGNERAWAVPLFAEYERFNMSEFQRVIGFVSQDKATALRLVSAFQAMAVSQRLISVVKESAGIKTPRPTPHQMILRKMTSARRRLARALIDLTHRLGGVAARETRPGDGKDAIRDRSQNL